jgi:hypothetical protein
MTLNTVVKFPFTCSNNITKTATHGLMLGNRRNSSEYFKTFKSENMSNEPASNEIKAKIFRILTAQMSVGTEVNSTTFNG